MPPPKHTTIPCPQCQQPVEIDLRQLLDLAAEPGLRQRFLRGRINYLDCAHCGAQGMLGLPFVVNDPAREQVIFYIPDDPHITPDIFQEIQRDLGQVLMAAFAGTSPPDYLFRPTLARDLGEVVQLLQPDEAQPPAGAAGSGPAGAHDGCYPVIHYLKSRSD